MKPSSLPKTLVLTLVLTLALVFFTGCPNEEKTEVSLKSGCEGLGYELGYERITRRGYDHIKFGPEDKEFSEELKTLLGPKPDSNLRAFNYVKGRTIAAKHLGRFIDQCQVIVEQMPKEICAGAKGDGREANFRRAIGVYIYMRGQRKQTVDMANLDSQELLRVARTVTAETCGAPSRTSTTEPNPAQSQNAGSGSAQRPSAQ